MLTPLRTILILLFLAGGADFSSAQDTMRCLVIEHANAGRTEPAYGMVQLKTGDPIMVRTSDHQYWQSGTITTITDSTITLSSIRTVIISRVTEIKWGPKDGGIKKRSAGIAACSMASALFPIYQFMHGTGSRIGAYIAGGIALATLAVVGYLSYRSGKIIMKHKRSFIHGNWKLSAAPVNAAGYYLKT